MPDTPGPIPADWHSQPRFMGFPVRYVERIGPGLTERQAETLGQLLRQRGGTIEVVSEPSLTPRKEMP